MLNDKQVNIKARLHEIYSVELYSCNFVGNFPFVPADFLKDGEWTNFIDSLFTSVSATCVTGLIVFDTFTHWTVFGQIVILTMIQIGGLGLMTIITMISIFLRKRLICVNAK